MKKLLVSCACLLAFAAAHAQVPAAGDAWSAMPQASDDRFSNPKSKLYAGPNGWWGTGQVRAVVNNPAKTPAYEYRGSFSYNKMFSAVDSAASQLKVMGLDFGTGKPAPGTYTASAKPDAGQKRVQVSFGDVSGQKIRNWTSADNAGSVTVSQVNGFLYVRFRDVLLQPNGIHNTGELKHPMTVGFEGAMPPER
ncbi:MAG: hypothetical protein ABI919_12700 [Ramlibacter sp.]